MAASLVNRMIRAARLDPTLYEEIEADPGTLGQAAAVIVIVSIASGIGSLAYAGISGLLLGTIFALLGWVVWAVIIWAVGTKVLPQEQTRADIPEVLRTLAFAASPGVFHVLRIIPGIGGLISLAVMVWTVIAMVIAVRQVLDYTGTGRAVGVVLLGFVAYLVLNALIALPMMAGGPPAAA